MVWASLQEINMIGFMRDQALSPRVGALAHSEAAWVVGWSGWRLAGWLAVELAVWWLAGLVGAWLAGWLWSWLLGGWRAGRMVGRPSGWQVDR